MKLSWCKTFVLKIRGRVFWKWGFQKGWAKPYKLYVCRCSFHGLYSGHLYGAYDDKSPQCPKCLEELAKKVLFLNQKV